MNTDFNTDDLTTKQVVGKKVKVFHNTIRSDILSMIKMKESVPDIEREIQKRFRGYLRSRWNKAQREFDLCYVNEIPVDWKPKAVQFPKLSKGYGREMGEKIKRSCDHYEKMPYMIMNLALEHKYLSQEDKYAIFKDPTELKKQFQKFIRKVKRTVNIFDSMATMIRVGKTWVMRVVFIGGEVGKSKRSRQSFMSKITPLWKGMSNFLPYTRGGLRKKFFQPIEQLLISDWEDERIMLTQGILLINGIQTWYHGDNISKFLKPRTKDNDIEREEVGVKESPYDKIETYCTAGPDDHCFFNNSYLKHISLKMILDMIGNNRTRKKREWTKEEVQKLKIPKLPNFNFESGFGATV